MSLVHIKSKNEFDEAIKHAGFKVTIVDFTATWCGPCKMIGPIFENFSKDKDYSNVKFIKVDVDELEDVSSEAKVEAMPSFFVYKNGKKVDELVGASEGELKKLIEKHN
jgi:thioredoxin 1